MKKQFSFFLSVSLVWLSWVNSQAQLTQVSSFGSNPGNLAMYRYVPANMPANAPLVVVMHGCTQDATTYFNETGWQKLADTYKFYLVFPQQGSGNNSSKCFNWFESGDITKGQGEALSIKQMTDNMKSNYSIDNNRVFATGLSAGGAMTTVMCATYPEIFKGGAVMAGLPYKAGIGTTAAFQAMSPGVDKTPQQWGDLVRPQNSSFSGTWPRMAVFHGSSDFTVRPMNMTEIAEQWANVNGIDATVDVTNSNFDGVTGITRRVYNNASNQAIVTTFEINGMGHAITVDPGTGVKQGGATGGYSVDKDFWSSYWAAEFWGILNASGGTTPTAPTNLTATATSSTQINLTWTDNASDETGYTLERSTTSGSGFTAIANLGANITSFSNTGLNAATTYYYRITASNTNGNSAYSNQANATTQSGTITTYTIEQLNGNTFITILASDNTGQSFTTSQAGQITKIEVKLKQTTTNSVLKIFVGNTVSGTALYQQSGLNLGSGWQTITLNTPFDVNASQQYTFQVTRASILYNVGNSYTGGNFWYNAISYTTFDAVFKVSIAVAGGGVAFQAENPVNHTFASDFTAYPNPAKETIFINFPKTVQTGMLYLYDSKGKLLKNNKIQNENELQWNISGLQSGLYFIKIETEDTSKVLKIIRE